MIRTEVSKVVNTLTAHLKSCDVVVVYAAFADIPIHVSANISCLEAGRVVEHSVTVRLASEKVGSFMERPIYDLDLNSLADEEAAMTAVESAVAASSAEAKRNIVG